MKAVKIKVELTRSQKETFDLQRKEAAWIWNKGLTFLLRNHSVTWYAQAMKWSGKVFPEFDFSGIVPTPLRFSQKSAWMNASCQIAIGGPKWVRDDKAAIACKEGDETKYERVFKLVPGDREWERIPVTPHSYPMGANGKQLTKLGDLDRVGLLNEWRTIDDLPPLTLHSDYIGGVLLKLDASWKAFLSPSNSNAKKPKFKHEGCDWLFNGQKGFSVVGDRFNVPGLGLVQPCDRSYKKRLADAGDQIRSYTLIEKPSGFYLCASVALTLESDLVRLKKQLAKAKKVSLEEAAPIEAAIAEKQSKLEFQRSLPTQKDLSAGFDPGIRATITSERGDAFSPNLTRERIAIHIQTLQARLDERKNINDRAWKEAGNIGSRPPTQNEIKLAAKISRLHEKGQNSGKAYNHKLSTRLSRTYRTIAWEDTDLLAMVRKTEPKMRADGTYEQNGAEQHSRLTRRLLSRSLGDLRSLVEQKAIEFILVPAEYSSLNCHCCQEKGQYDIYANIFKCANQSCEMLNVEQNGDANAAQNFARQLRDR